MTEGAFQKYLAKNFSGRTLDSETLGLLKKAWEAANACPKIQSEMR